MVRAAACGFKGELQDRELQEGEGDIHLNEVNKQPQMASLAAGRKASACLLESA